MPAHYHPGDSSPCEKDCPPSRRETSEAERIREEINKLLGFNCLKERETNVIASALSEKDARIEVLTVALREVEYYSDKAIDDERGCPFCDVKYQNADKDTTFNQDRFVHQRGCLLIEQVRAVLASTQPGEQGNLPTFTALGDPVQPGSDLDASEERPA